jgi:hypothetical protein
MPFSSSSSKLHITDSRARRTRPHLGSHHYRASIQQTSHLNTRVLQPLQRRALTAPNHPSRLAPSRSSTLKPRGNCTCTSVNSSPAPRDQAGECLDQSQQALASFRRAVLDQLLPWNLSARMATSWLAQAPASRPRNQNSSTNSSAKKPNVVEK